MKRDDPNAILNAWLATRQLTSDMRAETRDVILAMVTDHETGDRVEKLSSIAHKVRSHELWIRSFSREGREGRRLDLGRSLGPKTVDFSNRNLRTVSFAHSCFWGADFSGSDLTGANFSGADIRGAKFTNANATDVNFEQSVLTSVDFTGAKLRRAYFFRADLTESKGIAGGTLNKTKFFGDCWLPKELAESAELAAMIEKRNKRLKRQFRKGFGRRRVVQKNGRYFLKYSLC